MTTRFVRRAVSGTVLLRLEFHGRDSGRGRQRTASTPSCKNRRLTLEGKPRRLLTDLSPVEFEN